MNHEPAERTATLPIQLAMTAALFFMAAAAFAQTDAKAGAAQQAQTQTPEARTAEPEELEPPTLLVGDATQTLFARQRSGELASPTPRPISGSVASRSYERYVKSFEHPIPERLGSIVTKSNNAGGSAPAGGR